MSVCSTCNNHVDLASRHIDHHRLSEYGNESLSNHHHHHLLRLLEVKHPPKTPSHNPKIGPTTPPIGRKTAATKRQTTRKTVRDETSHSRTRED